MKLIKDYVDRFHNNNLPVIEKCLIVEEGDEIYINKWIKNGQIIGKAKDMFEWIERKYLRNKSPLLLTDRYKFSEIQERFYMKYWRLLVLLSDYQVKYRYYSKAINSIKNKSYISMNQDEFLKLFEKNKTHE
tara:strand:+ start:10985 stop:11380 length:396 start_codon:yes stop_codon:yes gene_type:complete